MNRRDGVNGASGLHINDRGLAVVGDRSFGKHRVYSLGVIPKVGETLRLQSKYKSEHDYGKRDLEDIDVLAGQYVALSERDSSIYGEHGASIRYRSNSDEWPVLIGSNQGLEGLAVQRDSGGNRSEIAVVWEGSGWSPRIYHHTIEHKDFGSDSDPLEIEVTEDCERIKLAESELRDLTGLGGSFRVPSLVFLPDGSGFIVLLCKWDKNAWIMQYGKDGKLVRGIRSLESLGMDSKDVRRNWEGIAWNGQNELVFISDNGDGRGETTRLFTASLPRGW